MVPLPVIMGLDGLKSNSSKLGEASKTALDYITSHIRLHSLSLKVQTSEGNYLTNLNVWIEQVDFTTGNPEHSMDDLILKAAIWHNDMYFIQNSPISGDSYCNDMPFTLLEALHFHHLHLLFVDVCW
ncbi:hypothetical protein BT96DRAFT_1005848 [Gymnopus androsaceus JB14]|uniref:PIN domain-containing protein n=1 Tax=Gymnopus androsaceus JB14 TaxID=1447944 RepID=A0A6A4GLN9_9AGAR|nr:hypothetical protein BT96DRAFT_1005848 [Gymnopus androsaceus JB14]